LASNERWKFFYPGEFCAFPDYQALVKLSKIRIKVSCAHALTHSN
jgi:hypothetical protein